MSGQSKGVSFAETLFNTTVGFSINFVGNLLILPRFGFDVGVGAAFGMGVIFTVISVTRGYFVRRLFNYAPFASAMERANAILNRYLRTPYTWLKSKIASSFGTRPAPSAEARTPTPSTPTGTSSASIASITNPETAKALLDWDAALQGEEMQGFLVATIPRLPRGG